MSLIIKPPFAIQKLRNVLPKTGQITSYQAGDDGDYEAGWWRRRLNANNKTRFVLKTFGATTVILDYATRLMWRMSDLGSVIWTAAITQCEAMNHAGFTDWKLPNILELMSVINFELDGNPMQYQNFNFVEDGIYWTSTTCPRNTLAAYCIDVSIGTSGLMLKADFQPYRACREF